MSPQEYTLNIRPGSGYAQAVKVSQGDVGRPLRFNLLDGAEALRIQTGTAITIHGTKPSGLGFTETCTWSGSAVSVNTTLEMTQENGMFPAELVLTLGNEVIGTANFMVNVERSPHDENTIDGTYDVADSIFARMDSLEEGLDATNDEIAQLKSDLAEIEPGLSDSAKTALLNCFAHVAWTDEHGQDYYDALESALYADVYPRITATFEAGTSPIYTDDSIDSLKTYLTVKYFDTKDSAGATIASENYTVSGTLTEGTSTITVSYNDLRTTVNVSGVINYYGIKEWSVENGLLHILVASAVNRSDGNVALSDVGTSTNRRTACTTKGAHRLINNYTSEETDWYAIPVPEDATAFTVGVTPNTQYTGARFWKYNESTSLYESIQNVGWKQGEFKGTINAPGKNLILTINTKYDSSGSSYPTEPTNIYVTFE